MEYSDARWCVLAATWGTINSARLAGSSRWNCLRFAWQIEKKYGSTSLIAAISFGSCIFSLRATAPFLPYTIVCAGAFHRIGCAHKTQVEASVRTGATTEWQTAHQQSLHRLCYHFALLGSLLHRKSSAMQLLLLAYSPFSLQMTPSEANDLDAPVAAAAAAATATATISTSSCTLPITVTTTYLYIAAVRPRR